MKMSLIAASVMLVGTCLLGGCSKDLPQEFSPYLEDTFRPWHGDGPANLEGQAFYKMPSGRLISCAGSQVTLLPANGYNLEAEHTIGMGKGMPVNYDHAAMKFAHTTMCDGYGHFSFQKLPAQNWIVVIHLSWQEDGSLLSFGGKNDKGGTLYQEVLLEPGDKKIVISNPDFVADQP